MEGRCDELCKQRGDRAVAHCGPERPSFQSLATGPAGRYTARRSYEVNKVEAMFVSTEGDYLEAVVEVSGERLYVMDEFGGSSMSPGQRIEIELEAQVWDPGDWDEIFRSNPEEKKALVRLEGWRYLALGQIVAVNPVVCDCGLIQTDGPIGTHDQRCIGEYVGFKIQRIDARTP